MMIKITNFYHQLFLVIKFKSKFIQRNKFDANLNVKRFSFTKIMIFEEILNYLNCIILF
jgi:hypothetical protein